MINKCYNCDGEGKTPSKPFLEWYNCPKEYQKEFNKSHPIKECGICQSEGDLIYENEEEYFNKLADRWEKETCLSSSIQRDHPCYLLLKNMRNKDFLIYALKKLKEKESWLCISLLSDWVNKNKNPIKPEMLGNIIDLAEAWINWGIGKKLIKKELKK